MNYLVHSFELGLNRGGASANVFKNWAPQAHMDGTPMRAVGESIAGVAHSELRAVANYLFASFKENRLFRTLIY